MFLTILKLKELKKLLKIQNVQLDQSINQNMLPNNLQSPKHSREENIFSLNPKCQLSVVEPPRKFCFWLTIYWENRMLEELLIFHFIVLRMWLLESQNIPKPWKLSIMIRVLNWTINTSWLRSRRIRKLLFSSKPEVLIWLRLNLMLSILFHLRFHQLSSRRADLLIRLDIQTWINLLCNTFSIKISGVSVIPAVLQPQKPLLQSSDKHLFSLKTWKSIWLEEKISPISMMVIQVVQSLLAKINSCSVSSNITERLMKLSPGIKLSLTNFSTT